MWYKAHFVWILFLIFFSPLTATEKSKYVLVSVSPHKYFIEQIAGDTVKAGLFVPEGASAHTFEPTPKQMLAASQADIWFGLGEPFEKKAVGVMQSHRPSMRFVDLRNGLDMLYDHHCCCCRHGDGVDTHIWLSPRLALQQAKTITLALQELYPEHRKLYQQNLNRFLKELKELDDELKITLTPMNPRVVMVSHPAYGYFARDYNLKQLSIEFEGKDPTPGQLTKIFNQARESNIKTIFVQPQYSSKGATLIANEINAKIVILNPYAEDFMNSMREIAKEFAKSTKNDRS